MSARARPQPSARRVLTLARALTPVLVAVAALVFAAPLGALLLRIGAPEERSELHRTECAEHHVAPSALAATHGRRHLLPSTGRTFRYPPSRARSPRTLTAAVRHDTRRRPIRC